jgi:hypothetical protein
MNAVIPYMLSTFQKWILFYFLKNKDASTSFEDLADNMCLSAIENFDIRQFKKELDQLVDSKLVALQIDATSGIHRFGSTLEGRLYVKQKILAPLIRARNDNKKLTQAITYLKSNPNREISDEIESATIDKDQNQFLSRLSGSALTHILQFLEILEKIRQLIPS